MLNTCFTVWCTCVIILSPSSISVPISPKVKIRKRMSYIVRKQNHLRKKGVSFRRLLSIAWLSHPRDWLGPHSFRFAETHSSRFWTVRNETPVGVSYWPPGGNHTSVLALWLWPQNLGPSPADPACSQLPLPETQVPVSMTHRAGVASPLLPLALSEEGASKDVFIAFFMWRNLSR